MIDTHTEGMTRRDLLTGAAGLAAGFTLVRPAQVKGAEANERLKLGVVGCGGRGTWIAGLFVEHGGYEIRAAADYFQDRVDLFADKFQVPADKRFTTLSGYKKLLEEDLDAVVIETPPCFHPEQAEAAVEAGRHTYVAKPVAVDVPGCLRIETSGKKATEKGLCFLVDFQTRANEFYREAIKRVHYGEIGRIVSAEAAYQTGRLGKQADPGSPEARLKNWAFHKALSGDIITEQNIHALDVATWVLDGHPLRAQGTGGRILRTDLGDCWDHFAVVFGFPKDVILTFSSKQCGKGWNDIMCRAYGATGTLDTHYGDEVRILGDRPYKGGKTSDIYKAGAVQNIADFHEQITQGRHENGTVEPSVRSNLATILGRTAAYKGNEVTWDEMMKNAEEMDLDLKGLKT